MKRILLQTKALVSGAMAVALWLALGSPTASAQTNDCGCDHVITPSNATRFVNGNNLNWTGAKVLPGQTVCLQAGFYLQILIENMVGTPDKPITIKNCGGQVVAGRDDLFGQWYGIDIRTSKYLRVTGTGTPDHKYGIKIGKSGDSGLKIHQLSSDTEIDHMEIQNCGFAGMLIKTDFSGNPPANASEMNNVNLHDNFIHDVRGEGMYIGETKTPGQNFRHLYVWNNIITRTGLDLIQIANAVEDVQVHHNVFYQGGLRKELYHEKGVQIGDNTVGRYYNNIIKDTYSNAFIVMGSGNIEIFKNYIEDVGADGMFIDNRSVTIPGSSIDILDNYIGNVKGTRFFNVYNEVNKINIKDNKLMGSNQLVGYDSGAGPGNVKVEDNKTTTFPELEFMDAASGDFRIASGSPYQELGLQENLGNGNRQPVLPLLANQEVEGGAAKEITVTATDPDGDAITLEGYNLPAFASFTDNGDGTGTFRLAPSTSVTGIFYNLRVRATDSQGAANSQGFAVTVTSPYTYLATASKFQQSPTEYNPPQNTLDGNLTTRWAAESISGSQEWIRYDLREDKLVTGVRIAFLNGHARQSIFDIVVSADGENWTHVFSGRSSGTTPGDKFETFPFDQVRARYLRINGYGNTANGWNSYNEVQILAETAPVAHAFAPVADVYLEGNTLYNTAVLKVKDANRAGFLRYTVSGLDTEAAAVVSAKLKLTALNIEGTGTLRVYAGSHSNWDETNLTRFNQPAAQREVASLSGAFVPGQTYTFDVSGAVAGNGSYTFVLVFEDNGRGVEFSSREGNFAPQLVVETLRGAAANPVTAAATGQQAVRALRKTNSLSLYPNPVADQLTIRLGTETNQPVTVEIRDQLGREVYRQNVNPTAGTSVQLNLAPLNLTPGVYLLRVNSEGQQSPAVRLMKK